MKLRIDPEAAMELRAAAAWYEERRVGLGVELLAAVDSAIQRICQSPHGYPRLETLPEEESVRRLLLRRFPYSVIYEATIDEVRVLAVAHTRRRPNYWNRRR